MNFLSSVFRVFTSKEPTAKLPRPPVEQLPKFKMEQVATTLYGNGVGSFQFVSNNPVLVPSFMTRESYRPNTNYLAGCTCREVFHTYFITAQTYPDKFYFVTKRENGSPGSGYFGVNNLVKLLRWVEGKVGSEPCKLAVEDLNKDTVRLQIEMSDFWKMSLARFQFLTAVVKNGMFFNADNISSVEHVKVMRYFTETKAATEKFLSGKTWTNHVSTHGWVNSFASNSVADTLREPTEDLIRTRAYYIHRQTGRDGWEKAKLDICGKK